MKDILRKSAIFNLSDLTEKEPNNIKPYLATIFEATTDFVITINLAGKVCYLNKSASQLLGADNNSATTLNIYDFYPPDIKELIIRESLPITIDQGICNMEATIISKAGIAIPVSQVLIAHKQEGGRLDFVSIIARDISDLKNAEKTLRIFARAFESTLEGMMITNAQGQIDIVNPAFSLVTGYTIEEVKGCNPNILQSGHHDKSFYARMWQQLQTTGQWQGEIWNRRKNGETYPEWLNISVIKDPRGNITNYVGIFSDITVIKHAEKHFTHLAHHDALTNLPNRLLFYDRLKQALIKANRHSQIVAIIFIDLDHFKPINDNLGHRIGDLVLQTVAERLKGCVREDDTVARFGGDEFIVILNNINQPTVVATVAQKIIATLSQEFLIEGHQLHIGASLGISIYPNNGRDGEILIKNADEAMYESKRAGRNCYTFSTNT